MNRRRFQVLLETQVTPLRHYFKQIANAWDDSLYDFSRLRELQGQLWSADEADFATGVYQSIGEEIRRSRPPVPGDVLHMYKSCGFEIIGVALKMAVSVDFGKEFLEKFQTIYGLFDDITSEARVHLKRLAPDANAWRLPWSAHHLVFELEQFDDPGSDKDHTAFFGRYHKVGEMLFDSATYLETILHLLWDEEAASHMEEGAGRRSDTDHDVKPRLLEVLTASQSRLVEYMWEHRRTATERGRSIDFETLESEVWGKDILPAGIRVACRRIEERWIRKRLGFASIKALPSKRVLLTVRPPEQK